MVLSENAYEIPKGDIQLSYCFRGMITNDLYDTQTKDNPPTDPYKGTLGNLADNLSENDKLTPKKVLMEHAVLGGVITRCGIETYILGDHKNWLV